MAKKAELASWLVGLGELKEGLSKAGALERNDLVSSACKHILSLQSSGSGKLNLANAMDCLLEMFGFDTSLQGPVCQIIRRLQPKPFMSAFRPQIVVGYGRARDFELYEVTRVYDRQVAELAAAKLTKFRLDYKKAAIEQATKTAPVRHVLDPAILQAIHLFAPEVALKESVLLTGLLVDCYLLTGQDDVLCAAIALVSFSDCLNPMLPVVLSLSEHSRVPIDTLDLIVRPRRRPALERPIISVSPAMCQQTPAPATPSVVVPETHAGTKRHPSSEPEPDSNGTRHPTPQPESKRPYRPAITKTADSDAEPLPEFHLEGPDE